MAALDSARLHCDEGFLPSQAKVGLCWKEGSCSGIGACDYMTYIFTQKFTSLRRCSWMDPRSSSLSVSIEERLTTTLAGLTTELL